MLRSAAIVIVAIAILAAAALWYGEQRYKDCLYVAIGGTQADNTGGSANLGVERVGQIHCSRSPF